MQDDTSPVNIALREVFANLLDPSEDLQRRNFSAIHRATFGLTSTSLDAALELSTADIDSKCTLGRTPLCWAATRTNPQHVKTLLRYGASLHLHDNRGQLPFHFASGRGAAKSLRVLLATAASMAGPDYRIDRDHKLWEEYDDDDDGDNSNEGSKNLGTPDSVSSFCLSLLNARDYKGRTPLHFASRINQVVQARLLLRYGADVNMPDTAVGRSPLHIAIYWNNHGIISLLLNQSARLDVVDDFGMSLLHYAAKFGDTKTLRILIRVGDSIRTAVGADYRNRSGQTPRQIFDEVRLDYLAEDEKTREVSRLAFEQLLGSAGVEEGYDSPVSEDDDVFFDAMSSPEDIKDPVVPPQPI